MQFLILYGTTEGQTRKIAEFVAQRIHGRGHTAHGVDATTPEANQLKLGDYDAAVIAASLHMGLYQAAVENFVRARHDTLNSMRTLFLSVSLSAASKDAEDINGLRNCLQRFLAATMWRPGMVEHVAGAFRFTKYDFFKRWGMKLIAYQKGVEANANQDLELTDWNALSAAVDRFIDAVEKAKKASGP